MSAHPFPAAIFTETISVSHKKQHGYKI